MWLSDRSSSEMHPGPQTQNIQDQKERGKRKRSTHSYQDKGTHHSPFTTTSVRHTLVHQWPCWDHLLSSCTTFRACFLFHSGLPLFHHCQTVSVPVLSSHLILHPIPPFSSPGTTSVRISILVSAVTPLSAPGPSSFPFPIVTSQNSAFTEEPSSSASWLGFQESPREGRQLMLFPYWKKMRGPVHLGSASCGKGLPYAMETALFPF